MRDRITYPRPRAASEPVHMGQLAGRNLRLECFGWRKNRRITPNLEHFPDLLVPQKLRQANSFRQATVPLDPVHPSTRLWLTGGFATAVRVRVQPAS